MHKLRPDITSIVVSINSSLDNVQNETCDLDENNIYRLPRNVVPQHYHLNLITYLDEAMNYSFSGQIAIAVRCVRPTKEIILHALELDIDEKNLQVLEIMTNHVERKQKSTNNTLAWIDRENLVKSAGYLPKVNETAQNDFYRIELNQEMNVGETYVVMIKFTGLIKETLSGYYRCSYKKENGEKEWLSVTQFEPTDARRAFPCFDEPDMKATFDINMLHRKKYRAISNAPAVSITEMMDNPDWLWTNFTTTPKMSTYLVFFMVSDFEVRDVTKFDYKFEVYAMPRAINQTNFALRESPNILNELTQYLYTPYALQKWPVKMIAVPEFSAGAMENWGAVTFRESLLLYDDVASDTKSRYSIVSVIAHELTHQWLGNLVTLKWWNDLWLNEGVTTYVTGLIVEQVHPEWNSLLENTAKTVMSLLEVDSLKGSHQVSVKIDNPNDIGQIFDSISYSKGSMILRMLDLILADNIFRLGLKSYLSEHAYSNAQKDDLWKHLSASYRKKLDKNETKCTQDDLKILSRDDGVKTIMDSWTLQTGYPLINVKRNYEKDTAYITQERYLLQRMFRNNSCKNATYKHEKDDSSDNKQCWYVPLSYTTESEKDFNNTRPRKWLVCPENMKYDRKRNLRSDNMISLGFDNNSTDDEEDDYRYNKTGADVWKNYGEDEDVDLPGTATLKDMPGKDQWVIFNIQMAGIYRVNYDLQNWEKLILYLQSENYDKIHILNRVQLIDDSLDLAWTGDQDYSVALKLVSYLKQETEYIAWNCALKNLAKLKKALMYGDEFPLFEKYISQFISPMYERLGGISHQLKIKKGKSAERENLTDHSRPEDIVKHRILISSWACRYAISDCRQKAVSYFEEFMNAHKTKSDRAADVIPADIVSIVYCTAVRFSDQVNKKIRSETSDDTRRKGFHNHPVVRTYSTNKNNTDKNSSLSFELLTDECTSQDVENVTSASAFEFLWNLAGDSNLAQTQVLAILKALACTTDKDKALRYLNASLDRNSFIRRQDAQLAFSGVASNSKTFMVARKFLYERIKDIYEYLGPNSNKLGSYVDAVADQITTQKDYDELVEFTKQNAKYLARSQLIIKKSLESAQLMIHWQQKHYDRVIKLLKEYTQD
ncbi:aminopeptidase N-like [Ctenocephalides felis]|uniref:aminopeptidase N-like n=1 Tax=Ctenocephalides felis TaxID=7515 RepID=UPI000E6E3FB8|nr:aminopeptidase N-like [Ctenocephalides felis]